MKCSTRQDDDSQAEPKAAKPRILVVDDNADAANSLGRLLSLLGHEVRVVHNGASALSEIDRFGPQAVLLDLGMPIMDGFETAEQIRARPEFQDVALVAITGWGQDRDRQRTDAAGFAAHLIKPVNLDQLEAVLRGISSAHQSSATSPNNRPALG
jgi:CheY-like chemotaxis protein